LVFFLHCNEWRWSFSKELKMNHLREWGMMTNTCLTRPNGTTTSCQNILFPFNNICISVHFFSYAILTFFHVKVVPPLVCFSRQLRFSCGDNHYSTLRIFVTSYSYNTRLFATFCSSMTYHFHFFFFTPYGYFLKLIHFYQLIFVNTRLDI